MKKTGLVRMLVRYVVFGNVVGCNQIAISETAAIMLGFFCFLDDGPVNRPVP